MTSSRTPGLAMSAQLTEAGVSPYPYADVTGAPAGPGVWRRKLPCFPIRTRRIVEESLAATQPDALVELVERTGAYAALDLNCPMIEVDEALDESGIAESWLGGCALPDGQSIEGTFRRFTGDEGVDRRRGFRRPARRRARARASRLDRALRRERPADHRGRGLAVRRADLVVRQRPGHARSRLLDLHRIELPARLRRDGERRRRGGRRRADLRRRRVEHRRHGVCERARQRDDLAAAERAAGARARRPDDVRRLRGLDRPGRGRRPVLRAAAP